MFLYMTSLVVGTGAGSFTHNRAAPQFFEAIDSGIFGSQSSRVTATAV